MKKIAALLLTLCMVFALAACGSAAAPAATEAPAAEAETPAAEAEAPAAEETAAAAGDYTLGMGISLSTDSSKTGNAQVDATVAAVVTDADGKIVVCRLDVAQS